jgi:hypothetical protein
MTEFPIEIPWATGGTITVEYDDGLTVGFDGVKLDSRAQTLATTVVHYWATRHIDTHPPSPGSVWFSAGPDLVFCNSLTAEEAEQCLHDLLTAIRISATLGAVEEKVA